MKNILLVATALITFTPAHAQEGELFKSLLTGSGLIGKKPEIDYKERPPLVVPKSTSELPPPVDTSTKRSAQWPQDPDIERTKREKVRQATFATDNVKRTHMTREELDKGWGSSDQLPKTRPAIDAKNAPQMVGGPKPGLMTKDEDVRLEFKGEGERANLTQPPSGYRTPSANQPFGPVGKTDYSDPNEKKDKK